MANSATALKQKVAAPVKDTLFSRIVNPIGEDGPADWNPHQIRYYKLSYRIDQNIGLKFFYSDQGIFRNKAAQIKIDDFINELRGAPPGTSANQLPLFVYNCDISDAPNFIINDDGYVVIELDANLPNWHFATAPGYDAITAGEQGSDRFFQRRYVDDVNGGTWDDPADVPGICRVIYMSVGDVAEKTASANTDVVDPFSLTVQLDRAGAPLFLILDPDIKNHGTDPDSNG